MTIPKLVMILMNSNCTSSLFSVDAFLLRINFKTYLHPAMSLTFVVFPFQTLWNNEIMQTGVG